MLRTILTNLSAAVLLFLILVPPFSLPFERKDEMTHDDIINKEIEEEHEFMRARIKELKNKPTYPFNEAFNKQLQEENKTLKSENFTFEELIKIQEKLIGKYEQTLNSIEKYQQRNCETCVYTNTQKCNISCQVFVILATIHKAKSSK